MTKDAAKFVDPMENGNERARVMFWKGETAGDYLIGKVIRFSERMFDGQTTPTPIAHFEPGAVADGKKWTYVREAQVVLSTELRARINPTTDRTRIFAIRFDGLEAREGKNDARLYTVVEQNAAKLGEILAVAEAQ